MKHLQKLSFAGKILLLTFLIILFMALILSFTSWRLSSSLFSDMSKELIGQSVNSIYIQLSTATNTANNLVTQVIHSSGMQAIMAAEHPEEETAGIEALNNEIQSVLKNSATSPNATLQFINVYLKNGWKGGSLPPEALPHDTFSQWCDLALDAAGVSAYDTYVPICWLEDVNLRSSGVYGHCLVGVRFLYDNMSLEKIGAVVVGIKQSGLRDILSTYNTTLFLVHRDGKIIAAPTEWQLGDTFEQAEPIIRAFTGNTRSHLVQLPDGSETYVYKMSGGASWLMCPIDQELLTHSTASTTYGRMAVAITLVALALTLLLAWASSKGLTRSLRQLTSMVQKVYDGDLSARFQTNQHDEIAYLGLKINDMLEQVDASFRIQERDAMEKKDLELQLMQAQISPHLLYNTLNSALWLIRQGDTEKVENLIFSLSSFFKLALSKGQEEIPLSSEIAMIQRYLEVQNLARGKSFHLRDEVPEHWRAYRILRLTLQPLVENSVIHGFCDWRNDGEVVLSLQPDEAAGQLRIVLCDNGIGILPEELEALMLDLHTYPPAKEHRHYGLYNVERRIKNKYGSQYGMQIESEVGEFTKITLTLPVTKETSHD